MSVRIQDFVVRRIGRSGQIAIFAAIVLTAWACSGSQQSTNQSAIGDSASSNNASSPAVQKPSSQYPPLASAVAQSDLKNLDGTTFKVADKKGKVVLLNLWATWCGPCRSEMPALVRMQNEHRADGLEIIGVNTDDETVEKIDSFAAEMGLNYTLVWGDTKMQNALLNISKFPGIPQSFLVDRDGNLRGVFRGANAADVKKMEQLVALVVAGGPTDETAADQKLTHTDSANATSSESK
jgi:thiol-disulfide isomerase/thioredoxin